MKGLGVALTIFIFLLSTVVFGKELTLQRFIALAEKNDPKYKRIFLDRERLKHIKDQGLPSRQVMLSLEEERGFGSSSNSKTSVITGEVKKEIIEMGTELSVLRRRTARPDRNEDVLRFRVEQSLYKNFFGRDVRLKKSSLAQEQELGELRLLEEYEDYLLSLATVYLDYQKALLDARLSEKFYRESIKLKQNVHKKLKAKIANRTDLNRSSLFVLLRRENMARKQSVLNFFKGEIERLSGLVNPSIAPYFLNESYLSLEKKIDTSFEENFRPLLIAKLEKEVARKNAILKDREDDFSLNLIAGYTKDNVKSLSSTFNRNEAIVGLKLEVPLGDSKGKAETSIAKVEEYQAELKQKEVKAQMEKSLADLRLELAGLKERVKINKEKIGITKKILKEEERRYAYGGVDLEKFIEVNNNYATYRFEYQASLVDFRKTIFRLYALRDKLTGMKSAL